MGNMVPGTLMYSIMSSYGTKAWGATFDEVAIARGHGSGFHSFFFCRVFLQTWELLKIDSKEQAS